MKERGIIFTGDSVRAILAGRKTQTRRIVTAGTSLVDGRAARVWPDLATAWVDAGPSPAGNPGPYLKARRVAEGDEFVHRVYPRVGAGERLWVREGFGGDSCCGYGYRADHPGQARFEGDGEQPDSAWRSPLYMPRAASRLTLDVTGVRVERLQDITEEDARAEGVETGVERKVTLRVTGLDGKTKVSPNATAVYFDPRAAYCHAWQAINGRKAPWSSNPWVWCVSFAVAGGEGGAGT